ncbi:hypothetical protein ACFQ2B_32055 [Streptomyces stramineus]
MVKAEVAAHRRDVTGADGLDEATAAKVVACTREERDCPVRSPVYRDLTGDGHEDMVVGIDMADHFLSLRCYTVVKGELTRIMAAIVQPSSIEVAGRELIVWEPSTTPTTPSARSTPGTRTAAIWSSRATRSAAPTPRRRPARRSAAGDRLAAPHPTPAARALPVRLPVREVHAVPGRHVLCRRRGARHPRARHRHPADRRSGPHPGALAARRRRPRLRRR